VRSVASDRAVRGCSAPTGRRKSLRPFICTGRPRRAPTTPVSPWMRRFRRRQHRRRSAATARSRCVACGPQPSTMTTTTTTTTIRRLARRPACPDGCCFGDLCLPGPTTTPAVGRGACAPNAPIRARSARTGSASSTATTTTTPPRRGSRVLQPVRCDVPRVSGMGLRPVRRQIVPPDSPVRKFNARFRPPALLATGKGQSCVDPAHHGWPSMRD